MSGPFALKALRTAIAAIMLLHAGGLLAGELTKSTREMKVYLGVIPAEEMKGKPEAALHHGIPSGKGLQHVTVVLFDRANGQRLGQAEVSAKVGELGLSAVQKKLEPMVIDNTVSWGNYFPMPRPGQYRIDLKIRLPGMAAPEEVSFDYSK